MNHVVGIFPWSWQTVLLTRCLFFSMDLARRWPEPSGTPPTSCVERPFGLSLEFLLESVAWFRTVEQKLHMSQQIGWVGFFCFFVCFNSVTTCLIV